jgi:hypothetical protein
VAQPRDSHLVADGESLGVARSYGSDLTHHFVTRRDMWAMNGEITFGDVKVGTADPARPNRDEEFTFGRIMDVAGTELEWMSAHRPRGADAPRAHHPSGHESIVL